MELRDVIYILKTADWQAADEDEPEGARFIVISETLVDEMIEVLEQHRRDRRLRSTSDRDVVARLTKVLYWFLNLYPRRCRKLDYWCEHVYPYGFVPQGGCPIHD